VIVFANSEERQSTEIQEWKASKKLGPPGPRVAEVGSETQLVLGLLSYESFLARCPLLLLHPSLVISCAPSLSSTDMYYV
jgi:hypothetical protein